MKWIAGVVTLAIVVFGLYYRYDVYQKNQRIEALNDRIAVINAMTEITNLGVSYTTDCQNYVVKWYEANQSGDSSKAMTYELFAKSCGESMRSTYKDLENEAQKQRNRGGPDTPAKQAYFQASLDYGAAHRAKGSDFDDIYQMMKTATDRGDPFGPLANAINEKLDNGQARIDDSFEQLDAARSAYRNDFD